MKLTKGDIIEMQKVVINDLRTVIDNHLEYIKALQKVAELSRRIMDYSGSFDDLENALMVVGY